MFPLSLLIRPQFFFFFCLIQSKRKGLDILVGVGIGVDIDARVHPSVSLSCLTLCDPMDSSPPGSSVWGILQARILEWVAMPSSRGPSWPRDRTQVSCVLLCRQILYLLSHQEVHRHRWGPGRTCGRWGWPGLDVSCTLTVALDHGLVSHWRWSSGVMGSPWQRVNTLIPWKSSQYPSEGQAGFLPGG